MLQLPALLAAYPTAAPATLLGTNKLGSICGTASAAWRYRRVAKVPWTTLIPAMGMAFAAALLGAHLVSTVSPKLFRPLVPVMLSLVLAYVGFNSNLGRVHAPRVLSMRQSSLALACIAAIGLYDGFFGPGTGSFLMLLLVRVYGFDFLHASAGARAVNVATNAGALLIFALHADVQWGLGLALGGCNAAGSVLGTRTAIKHGSGFVRIVLMLIVLGLIVKTATDAIF